MVSALNLRVLLISTLLIPMAVNADARRFYVQFNAGAAFAADYLTSDSGCDSFFGCFSYKNREKFDPGYVAGAALGYRFANNFRLEGEAMFQSNELNKSIVKVNTQNFGSFTETNALQGERERTTFLINGYYDFKNCTAFTPFLTAGIGGYHLRINANRGRQSGDNSLDFAWQLGAGFNYALNETISLDLKYRFLSGTNAGVVIPGDFFGRDRTEHHDVGDNQVMVGVRVGL